MNGSTLDVWFFDTAHFDGSFVVLILVNNFIVVTVQIQNL